jgi:hypothetical protein
VVAMMLGEAATPDSAASAPAAKTVWSRLFG